MFGPRVKRSWLYEHPWVVYSQRLNAAFCKYCALFAVNREKLGIRVNRPFTQWHKKSEKFKEHEKAAYHRRATQDAEVFIRSIENSCANIDIMIDDQERLNVQKNRHILKCMIECVLLCARQCIALRGDKENLKTSGNPGNFLSLIHALLSLLALSRIASSLLRLVPSVIAAEAIDLTEMIELYASDLPAPELAEQEVDMWATEFRAMHEAKRPSSCAAALKGRENW
ncbi:hypothetical protein CAPTEDRAFT_193465 [Capitella teleta]|uniref:Uncharacterized protein n=1 Tax=Capitella teleta TaxID=283909 RepID=R7U2U8_CAPTE|nr:hypothetical protein CAPTEDRAFT_193465 [Capitella teleta]|eukprot:ELT97505.1 hypothetical protein CAPTEDRAFT_193465 [Capitella teleta]